MSLPIRRSRGATLAMTCQSGLAWGSARICVGQCDAMRSIERSVLRSAAKSQPGRFRMPAHKMQASVRIGLGIAPVLGSHLWSVRDAAVMAKRLGTGPPSSSRCRPGVDAKLDRPHPMESHCDPRWRPDTETFGTRRCSDGRVGCSNRFLGPNVVKTRGLERAESRSNPLIRLQSENEKSSATTRHS
ncbi:hypothetical protein-signal peptide prediction [Rhodopirellula baltica SH 1]|uniref:Uncharacterized protein n=1 Tax=Rhodopirellula baltica (strain DSM 10527 / NCIMB 13988 / SH1) TaxID=243090 RepID=Q7UN43_RHOBA|nr:hypothetical protein-signal peptide prediction [Rhodopirellula baltica SH 1]